MSDIVDVHVAYIRTISDLNQDKAELLKRIKRLEEQLMDVKNEHAVLVADVVLRDDKIERIKQLEDRIHRAASAFFRDGSDGHVASQMLQILEEERGNVSKEPIQSDSSIWAKAGIGFTTEDKP